MKINIEIEIEIASFANIVADKIKIDFCWAIFYIIDRHFLRWQSPSLDLAVAAKLWLCCAVNNIFKNTGFYHEY